MTKNYDDWIRYVFRGCDETPKKECTEEHLEIFKDHTENWKRDAFSTEAIDKPNATAAINALYKLEGLEAPHIIWTKSPLANVFAKLLCEEILQINSMDRVWNNSGTQGDRLWESIGPSVTACVNEKTTKFRVALSDGMQGTFGGMDDPGLRGLRSCTQDALNDAVSLSAGHKVPDKLNVELCEAAWKDICKSVEFSLGVSPADISDKLYSQELRHKFEGCFVTKHKSYGNLDYPNRNNLDSRSYVRRKLLSTLSDKIYTQYHSAKISEYMALFDCGLIPKIETLNELHKLCASTGWVMPHRTVCYVSERPEILKVGETGLPHCANGPAIQYSDGFSIHAWQGVRIPKYWCKTPPSPHEALHWHNQEQRRVACEHLGWAQIIEKLDATVIDKDADPEIGELLTVKMPNLGHQTFLRVKCGTGRDFAITVPPEMTNARQANAWTWGLDASEYKPEVRT